MFLPTTKDEMKKLGWNQPDVIIVSGDTYIDNYYDGAAVIGKVLTYNGYKVAIIAQPDIDSDDDITRLGEPLLFWGVTAGCVDSMVSNYTSLKKRKKSDDLTPGGFNTKRPDRATIIYTNLIKRNYKSNKPIILGGIEASLRRIAHYDYWSDSVRRSVLFDSKADCIVYGMGEKTILSLADKISKNENFKETRGICYVSKDIKSDYIELPSYEEVKTNKLQFINMFHTFYKNNDPINAKGLVQKHGDRFLIQNPPQYYHGKEELDKLYEIEYERQVHPYYKNMGIVKALDTIQFSINSHRGCYGECNFCAITVHQGRTINSRSEDSIIREVKSITKHTDFKGIISDVGGPTANMYGNECNVQLTRGSCKEKRCAFPKICKSMEINHSDQISLYEKLRYLQGIRKIFIGSGIRYDLVLSDTKSGKEYFINLVENHVSGQLKIAPEHTDNSVLGLMGKPDNNYLTNFKDEFYKLSQKIGKKQFLTYYFISAHPGCNITNMQNLDRFISQELKFNPEQVQIFNPTPSTYSTLMYYTELDPFTLEIIFVEKSPKNKLIQKEIIVAQKKKSHY